MENQPTTHSRHPSDLDHLARKRKASRDDQFPLEPASSSASTSQSSPLPNPSPSTADATMRDAFTDDSHRTPVDPCPPRPSLLAQPRPPAAAETDAERDPERQAKRPRIQPSSSSSSASPSPPSSPRRRSPPPSPARSHAYRTHKRRANSLPNIRPPSPSDDTANPHITSPSSKAAWLGNFVRRGTMGLAAPPQLASSSSSTPARPPVPQPGTSRASSSPAITPPHVPSLHPLITRDTLKELDLEAILRNPQLRHDLLFDPGLQFRPTSGRRKREATEKYWLAVQRELELGCTCTSFNELGRLNLCVCHRDNDFNVRMPSRIGPLVMELREVLLSVIHPSPAPTATAVTPAAHLQAANHTAQAQQLRFALDPVLIEQEIRHGVFDPTGLFRLLGDTLKMHCAPMRDRIVERMVEVANQKGEAVQAIRMCFEILELMKLDIANHQLQALRPYLLETSAEFELKTFQDRHERGLLSLHTTRSWLQAAYKKLSQDSSIPKSKLVSRSLCTALVDLVFTPPSVPPTPAPATTTPASRPLPNINAAPGYPETLYLDTARLTSLTTDAADLTALYMLLMLYRQLVFARPHPAPRVEDKEIDRVKREIWEVGPPRLGLCFTPGRRGESEMKKWRSAMMDVVLQIAVRAEEVRSEGADRVPKKETLELLERWVDSNLREGSPLAKLLRTRLRDAVLDVVSNAPSPVVVPPATAGATGTGLEPLVPEIRHLGERMAKLAQFHYKVYSPLYAAEGFLR